MVHRNYDTAILKVLVKLAPSHDERQHQLLLAVRNYLYIGRSRHLTQLPVRDLACVIQRATAPDLTARTCPSGPLLAALSIGTRAQVQLSALLWSPACSDIAHTSLVTVCQA